MFNAYHGSNHQRPKEKGHLAENRQQALRDLLNTPQDQNKAVDEKIYFLLYLNYAVNNIVAITGISSEINDPGKMVEELKKMDDAKIQKLANFLWLFQVGDPSRDFKDYREITIQLVKKIYELRNLFAHPNTQCDIQAFLMGRSLFVILEGILLDLARANAISMDLRTDKLFKLKLGNKHTDLKDDKSDRAYELTRKGIIFLTCLALYKDEAEEFCSLFKDMQLPSRRRDELDPANVKAIGQGQVSKKTCNVSKAKALRAMFTYFSCRKGRDILNASDLDHMCFSDIITYLNKVPAPAFDYLTLEEERKHLNDLKEKSTESDDNKKFKYTLHRRFEERFLSFAAAYCEDFNLLPALRFKRLDVSETLGRKRYCFGGENDNRNRMDRHYAVSSDTLDFEFVPETHYGPIKIQALRSSISENEFKQMLFMGEKNFIGFKRLNEQIKGYFAAYHRVLESLLNEPDVNRIFLDHGTYKQDFCTVTGRSIEAMEDKIDLAPFFPRMIEQIFTGTDGRLKNPEMIQALTRRLNTMKTHADDFLKRIQKWRKWQALPKDEKTGKRDPSRPPKCTIPDEVMNPPSVSSFSDGELILQVFDLFNLFLTPECKFRQLSRGEQHHDGIKDHEYQLLHAAIGKYSLDQKGFCSFIEKYRSELNPVLDRIKPEVDRLLSQSKPQKGFGGKLIRRKTLVMLAEAATIVYRKECIAVLEKWKKADPCSFSSEALSAECRRYGIRTGMPLSRESLITSILGIDLAKWSHAFDYEAGVPFQNRALESAAHIVSQIPFPNGFAARLAKAESGNKNFKCFFDEKGNFDFSRAFRERCDSNVSLRNFYDIKPLIGFVREQGKNPVPGFFDPCREVENAQNESRSPREPELSASAVDKARRNLRKIELQDRLLLIFAMKYWDRFFNNITEKPAGTKPSVYDYFSTPVIKMIGKIRVSIYRNDLTRPAFSLIRKETIARQLVGLMNEDPDRVKTDTFDFYEMQKTLRKVQVADRTKRLEIIPLLTRLDERVNLAGLVYSENSDLKIRQKENRDLEFPCYQKSFPALTRDEFDILADIRNEVYHDGLLLNIEPAIGLLKRVLRTPRKISNY